MTGASSEVKNDSEDDEAYYGDDFDGAMVKCDYRSGSIRRIVPKPCVHSREDELGLSVCA